MHFKKHKKDNLNKTTNIFAEVFSNISREEFHKKTEGYAKRFEAIDKKWFEGKLCLDVGCGAGSSAYAFLRIKGTKVVAIDLNKECLGISAKHCKIVSEKGETVKPLFIQCDVNALPFKGGIFDFVNCNSVIHHLKKPKAAFLGLVRVLKTDGYMFIGVYGKGGLMNEVKVNFLRILTKIIPRALIEMFIPENQKNDLIGNLYVPIRKTFSEDEILGLFREQGFKRVDRLSAGFYKKPSGFYEKLKIGKNGMYMHFLGVK